MQVRYRCVHRWKPNVCLYSSNTVQFSPMGFYQKTLFRLVGLGYRFIGEFGAQGNHQVSARARLILGLAGMWVVAME